MSHMTRRNIIKPSHTDSLKRYREPAVPISMLIPPILLLIMPPQVQKSGAIRRGVLLLLLQELGQAGPFLVRPVTSKSRTPLSKLLARILLALSSLVILPNRTRWKG